MNSAPRLLRHILHHGNVLVGKKISNLLEKAVIVEIITEPGEFISSVFVRSKKDGSHRMILNLKNLNKHV